MQEKRMIKIHLQLSSVL